MHAEHHQEYLDAQVEMHKRLSEVYTQKRYAPPYSQEYQNHWNRVLCDLARLPAGARVLDFGCGTGVLFPELVRRGWHAVGIDLSEEMLAAAAATPEVERVCGDGCNTEFADQSFDGVLCRGSIHHLPDLEAGFREIARILRSGGVLAFSEPSNDFPGNRLARRVMYKRSQEFHEEDEGFRRSSILPLLDRCGFDVEVSRGFGFFAYTLAGFPDKIGVLGRVPGNRTITRMLIRVDRWLERLPGVGGLALHWQVRATKRTG